MGPKRKRFVDYSQLQEAARQIALHAEAAEVSVALVGGFALQIFGADRLTGDVDFIADRWVPSLPRKRALSFGGGQTFAPNGVPVDLIIREDEYASLYADALTKARHIHLDDDFQQEVWIARPEHLIAMKMASGRDRDELDLAFLVGRNIADRHKARVIIAKFMGVYAALEFDQLVEEVQWKMSRGKL